MTDGKVKVALFETENDKVIPAIIFNRITGTRKIDIRIQLANLLSEVRDNVDNMSKEEIADVWERDGYVKISNKYNREEFTYIFKQLGVDGFNRHSIVVKEVDTNKPWRISSISGKEQIEYNNQFNMVDTHLNYADWK